MSTAENILKEDHFINLSKSYSEVGNRTWLARDLLVSNVDVSQNLYTPESLVLRKPKTKYLEVYALVSGLSFCDEFSSRLLEMQRTLGELLGESLHYWVAPPNFGVEYCVFKWPTDPWSGEWLPEIYNVLNSIRQSSFDFSIRGIQINPDGCVVAKGFDQNAAIFKIRDKIKKEVPFLPAKQSGWSHVPLGRILEPLGEERFSKISRYIERVSSMPIASTKISSMKLVHETRWYMEERTILKEYILADGVNEGCHEG